MHRSRAPFALLLSLSGLVACSETTAPREDAGVEADATPDVPLDDGAGPDTGISDASTGDGSTPMPLPCLAQEGVVVLERGPVRVTYDMAAGTAAFAHGGKPRITSFYAGVQLDTYITSKMYGTRTCETLGDTTTFTSTEPGLPVMRQVFTLPGGDAFLVRLDVEGEDLETRWIGPVVMDTEGGVDVGAYGDVRALRVPFDNDAWVSYDARSINGSGTSFEVAAFYDNVTRNGLVVGSVTHDVWKTGIFHVGTNDRLNVLNVFGGVTDALTRDVLPHGLVRGDTVRSPTAFVGFGDDYRDLLEAFAAANAARAPKLPWNGPVPFGWNSWGKVQTNLSYAVATGVSDYIASTLTPNGFADAQGAAYVNLDSYWDNLSSTELASFVAHVRGHGQKAGIYWAPFVDWGKWADRTVEGTSYTYGQIWLRDASGNPIELDGAYAVDPTHPGTLARIDHFIDRFKAWGFDYLKLDFLTHGALESSVRHDPAVQTGIAAYHVGMGRIVDRVAGTMFISASIAPLFPHGYAHARRVACDTYGAAVGSLSTHYLMNSVTYGFWMSGSLYAFNDPDHMVFEGFAASDNVSRVISGAISGTVFLNGDDLTTDAGRIRASTYLTNPRLNAVARLGQTFRPLEGNTGTNPSDVFVLRRGNARYVAVFNFGGSTTTRTVDLARAGFDGNVQYTVRDLWTDGTSLAQGALHVQVPSHEARLLSLE